MWTLRAPAAAAAALAAIVAGPALAQIPLEDPSAPLPPAKPAPAATAPESAPATVPPAGPAGTTPKPVSGGAPAAGQKPQDAKPKPAGASTAPVDCKGLYEAGCRETPGCVWIADTKNADGSPATQHCQKKGKAAAKPAAASEKVSCDGMYEAGCRETPGCVWVADTQNKDGSPTSPHCQKKKTSTAKPAAVKPAAPAAKAQPADGPAEAASKPAAIAKPAAPPPPVVEEPAAKPAPQDQPDTPADPQPEGAAAPAP